MWRVLLLVVTFWPNPTAAQAPLAIPSEAKQSTRDAFATISLPSSVSWPAKERMLGTGDLFQASGDLLEGGRRCRWDMLAPCRAPAVRPQSATSVGARSWIKRHPVLFGSIFGFGAGLLVGYGAGDDGVFDDFTAEFNGVLTGDIGAGIGAGVGAIFSGR